MKRKEQRQIEHPQLNMTPMIDVVFQLMIFFLVTLQQNDLLSHLDVARPSPSDIVREKPLLTILVQKDGFALQGRRVGLEELDRQLTRLATFDKTMPLTIKCTGDSPHALLIQLLNLCAKSQLSGLSVLSVPLRPPPPGGS